MNDEAAIKTHVAYRKTTRDVLIGLLSKAGVKLAFNRSLDRATKYQLWHTLRETLFKQELRQHVPMRRHEMILVRMACHHHYAIPEEELTKTPKVLMEIINARQDKYGPNIRVAAAKTILAMRQYTLEQLRVLTHMATEGISDEDAGPRRIRSPLPMPDAQGDGQ